MLHQLFFCFEYFYSFCFFFQSKKFLYGIFVDWRHLKFAKFLRNFNIFLADYKDLKFDVVQVNLIVFATHIFTLNKKASFLKNTGNIFAWKQRLDTEILYCPFNIFDFFGKIFFKGSITFVQKLRLWLETY